MCIRDSKNTKGWVRDTKLFNSIHNAMYKNKDLGFLDMAAYITEDERYLVHPEKLKSIIETNIPEIKNKVIANEIKKLENIIPTDSYIKTSDYYKYIPKLTDKEKAAYVNRQGTGYLGNDYAEKHADFIVGGKSIYDVNNGLITKEQALENVNKITSEKFNSYSELEDYVYNNAQASQKFINDKHNLTKVTIPKDIYVTKVPYFAGSYKDMPGHHNVSALMVDPYNIKSVNALAERQGEVFRIPKGSKVNFVVEPKLSKEGFTEVVLDTNTLKKADKMKIKAANRLKAKIIAKYKQLGGKDISKLFSVLPLLPYMHNSTKEQQTHK